MSWEATAIRKFSIACKSEDLSVTGVHTVGFYSSLRARGWMVDTFQSFRHTTKPDGLRTFDPLVIRGLSW